MSRRKAERKEGEYELISTCVFEIWQVGWPGYWGKPPPKRSEEYKLINGGTCYAGQGRALLENRIR